jgi:outer membrane protein OmpA-like peptidoglycan-associated protein
MPQQSLRSLAVTAALLASAGLAGCASQPQSNAALDQVHQRLAQLEQNPVAKQQAGGAVNQAGQSVADADKAFRGGDTAEFNHALFMAERQLSTAEAQVRTQTARAQSSQLSGERDEILLHSRTAQLAQAQQELKAYRTRETSEGTVVTLYNLPFETGKAILQPGAAARLQPLVNYLHQNPDRHVMVEGNTDSTGRSEVNERLSQERADAVRNFLVANGISADRITAQGLGSSYPVASNDTAAGRLQNRRVDVVIEPAQAAALPPASR